MRKFMLALAAAATLALPSAISATEGDKPMPTPEDTSLHSYILLDRTGSMSGIWEEALTSVNAYAKSVGEEEEGEKDFETKVSVAVFDAQDGLQFDVLRKQVNSDNWTDVTNDEAHPRGMTPLFDAIGRLVAMAEADAPEKAVLVIMTDGHENASREMTGEGAKKALERAEKRGWEVVFLGAEFAAFSDADQVGVSRSKQMAVGAGQFSETMQRLSKKSRGYAKGEQNVEFDAEDREVAQEEDVKRRKGN
ncbi:MAG: vWA domain-containing protein [Pseudomonadota bacterium]